MNVSLKNAVGFGSVFPWPKPIARPHHPAMCGNISVGAADFYRVGISGDVDGNELRLGHYTPLPISRVNASEVASWSLTPNAIRAGTTHFLTTYYDSVDGCIYAIVMNSSATTDFYVNRINIVTGAMSNVSVGAISSPVYFSQTPTPNFYRLTRKVPGQGNLLLYRFIDNQIHKMELSPVNGSILSADQPLSSANGTKARQNNIRPPSYISADGVYGIGVGFEMADGSGRSFTIIKNGMVSKVAFANEGFMNAALYDYGTEIGEFYLADENHVIACYAGMPSRYYNRTEFDGWLKKIIDSTGI